MLKMISLKERAKVVFTTDSAVKASKEDKEDGKIIHLSAAEIISGDKPTVFTVRLLNSRERMAIAEGSNLSQTQALFTAAEKAVCRIDGPGIKAHKGEEITDVLLACDPNVVYLLAGWIMDQSSLKPDPLAAKK